MSAGTGIHHSEYNKNRDREVKFLQIWIIPNKKEVEPRYDQITLDNNDSKNKLVQILSPNVNDDGIWIYQNAWFHLGDFENEKELTYELKDESNGVYVFILEGDATIENQKLNRRDGFGLWNTKKISIKADSNSKLLLMEVPLANQ